MLLLAAGGVLAGARSYAAIAQWARSAEQAVAVASPTPHATTFGPVLAAVDRAALQRALTGWVVTPARRPPLDPSQTHHHPRRGLRAGQRRRRPAPPRRRRPAPPRSLGRGGDGTVRLGRGGDGTVRPHGLATRDAGDRPPRTPGPGAQLRITDCDGHRITAFVTNTGRGQLADLELRHRRRARAEDRIRCAKDTGLANLPLHDFTQNETWCAIVALAADLTAWTQTLALSGTDARRWEPKRLRLRLLSIPGSPARTGRLRLMHLAATAPFTALALQALAALDRLVIRPAIPAPG